MCEFNTINCFLNSQPLRKSKLQFQNWIGTRNTVCIRDIRLFTFSRFFYLVNYIWITAKGASDNSLFCRWIEKWDRFRLRKGFFCVCIFDPTTSINIRALSTMAHVMYIQIRWYQNGLLIHLKEDERYTSGMFYDWAVNRLSFTIIFPYKTLNKCHMGESPMILFWSVNNSLTKRLDLVWLAGFTQNKLSASHNRHHLKCLIIKLLQLITLFNRTKTTANWMRRDNLFVCRSH